MIQNFITILKNSVVLLRIQDILDILLIIFIVYKILMFIKESAAAQVLKGIIGLIVITQLLGLLQLNVSHYLLSETIQIGIIALIIIFQPELRRILDNVGRRTYLKFLFHEDVSDINDILRAVTLLSETVGRLSSTQTGALICIEKETKLGDIIKNGTLVNSDISEDLLCNIFYDKAPLHDGAVIVKDWRIAAAACRLPLSDNKDISRDLGMRHRAGLGLSETTDAFVIIVSEETGSISVAFGGTLKNGISQDVLLSLLKKTFVPEEKEEKKFKRLIFKGNKQ